MGSLYVVSGRSFTRTFTISTTEEFSDLSIYHQIENVRSFLDKAWPIANPIGTDTQNTGHYDGQIGDIACIVVIYSDGNSKKKVYKRNFGVKNEYTWTEEVGSE